MIVVNILFRLLVLVCGFASKWTDLLLTVRFDRLDVLCCNAGVMMLPYSLNEVGIETQFATNHLGHYLLVGTD